MSAFVELEDVRRRLEFFLAAAYAPEERGRAAAPVQRPVRIEPLAATRTDWRGLAALVATVRRLAPRSRGRTPGALAAGALAAVDERDGGAVIRLPPALPAPDGPDAALAAYRVMALVQRERLARRSAAHAPAPDARAAGRARLVRDLYHLAESAAAERAIARALPGVRGALAAAGAAALAGRPPIGTLTGIARDVEALARELLGGAPGRVPQERAAELRPSPDGSPLDSLAWAGATAAALVARYAGGAWRGRARGRYRGIAPVAHWGVVVVGATAPRPTADQRVADDAADPLHSRVTLPLPGTRAREAAAGEAADDVGLTPRATPARPEVDDTRGVDRADEPRRRTPAARDARDGSSDGAAAVFEPSSAALPPGPGVSYPEWDAAAARYVADRVTVRDVPLHEGDSGWADAVLRAHASVVGRVRERFEPLRAQRTRLAAQRRGDALDLAACVRAAADLRAGQTPDDRLYLDVRPARRPIATVLLVDVSGSTGLPIDGTRRVIDVEREAVLLAGAALDAIADPYAIFAFSSRSAANVRVHPIKRFTEPNGEAVRRRVSALQPGASTRLGAALRHMTAQLARQPAGHRLLLLLSDGRPNDDDGYKDRHALEDARHAVLEARAVGVVPFCLTVDREEPEAAAWVFGPRGYTVLQRPDQLPRALVGAVAHLLGR